MGHKCYMRLLLLLIGRVCLTMNGRSDSRAASSPSGRRNSSFSSRSAAYLVRIAIVQHPTANTNSANSRRQ